MKRIVLCLLAVLTLSQMLISCSSQTKTASNGEIFVMNTVVTQKVYGKNRDKAILNVNNCLKEMEKELSMYIPESYISKINQNAGLTPVKVNSYTFDLIQTTQKYCERSNGVFDITIAPITKLWGITSQNPKVPTQDQINELLPLIDYRNIKLDSKSQTVMLKEKGMAIDLGGIAKGYINDLIKSEYDKLNISSALISIGGNIYAYHTKPDNTLFTLGIRDPKGSSNDMVGKLKVKDKIVATSGAYERFFEQDGKVYHHILDSKTGYPAESDLLSATVVSENGGLADFLSTTVFISGKKQMKQYLNQSEFSVIIIDKEKNVYVSDNLKDSFELTNSNYKLSESK
ncbi:FAD:protein FMN transferase [Paludicola sp. MB14-C6]|uniref:FAD:protein FMN transferase n=1 Tax=Paludihabitans sp. MB14-C6 TaxID=3070656 RepID=UPI0027DC8161|nr:FAD:protein FMN transferase [Paludicola sp. MB14-C6]WMJ23303.1 FAD:protein FMN transferase [Paludicola sp. MB14-C6]